MVEILSGDIVLRVDFVLSSLTLVDIDASMGLVPGPETPFATVAKEYDSLFSSDATDET